MGEGRVFSSPTTDQMIFGQEMVSMLSVTLISVILHWTVTSFRADYSLTAARKMRIPCILAISCFLGMDIIGMIGWSNVFINITTTSCRIVYPLCLLLFNFGKISMYYLFTYRIDLIFKHTLYEISPLPLTIYRTLCAIVPTTFWVIWIYLSWDDLRPHDTDSANPQYQYCFPKQFKDQHLKLSAITSVCIGIADMVFSGIPLLLFIIKYSRVTALYRDSKGITHHHQHQHLHNKYDAEHYHALNATLNANLPGFEVKHLRIIRKSTMLVIIANVSTWCFVFGQALILRQLGFYLPFDGVINSLCISCLFQFGDDFYSVTCAKLECLCLCFGPQCNCWSRLCGCSCCGDLPGSNDGSHDDKYRGDDDEDQLTFTTSDDVENKYHHQYHAKIHSHRQDNAGFNAFNGASVPINVPSNNKAFAFNGGKAYSWNNTPTAGTTTHTGTMPTKINVNTPTQRFRGSPEQQLFMGPQSITEFIPLQLTEDGTVITNDTTGDGGIITPGTPSTTATSATMTGTDESPLQPANRTGSIPVIQKYAKPSKLGI